jgi:hypothetical protein
MSNHGQQIGVDAEQRRKANATRRRILNDNIEALPGGPAAGDRIVMRPTRKTSRKACRAVIRRWEGR